MKWLKKQIHFVIGIIWFGFIAYTFVHYKDLIKDNYYPYVLLILGLFGQVYFFSIFMSNYKTFEKVLKEIKFTIKLFNKNFYKRYKKDFDVKDQLLYKIRFFLIPLFIIKYLFEIIFYFPTYLFDFNKHLLPITRKTVKKVQDIELLKGKDDAKIVLEIINNPDVINQEKTIPDIKEAYSSQTIVFNFIILFFISLFLPHGFIFVKIMLILACLLGHILIGFEYNNYQDLYLKEVISILNYIKINEYIDYCQSQSFLRRV